MSVRILTEAQYKMLCSARRHGDAFWHVRDDVRAAIHCRNGLIDRGLLRFGDVYVEITDAGRQALEKIEAQP